MLIVNAMGTIHPLTNIVLDHLTSDLVGVSAFPVQHSFDGRFAIKTFRDGFV